jgi:8-oxo-dGTP pyrophosphatase MutT (NUDIX family)
LRSGIRICSYALWADKFSRGIYRNPYYKPNWETPGGITEENESPRNCAAREILEELSLEIQPKRLLVVDYNSAWEDYTESLMWIFDGGVLTDAQILSINLPVSELEELRFVDLSKLPEFVHPRLAKRLEQAFQTVLYHQTLYTENQFST